MSQVELTNAALRAFFLQIENTYIYTASFAIYERKITYGESERSCANAKREKARKQNVKISQNENFFVFFLHFNTQQRKTHVAILCSSKEI